VVAAPHVFVWVLMVLCAGPHSAQPPAHGYTTKAACEARLASAGRGSQLQCVQVQVDS